MVNPHKVIAGMHKKKIELTEEERQLLMFSSSDEEPDQMEGTEGSLLHQRRKRDEK